MVQVSLTGSFRAAIGGAASVQVEADTIRELFARLLDRYPALQDHLDEGIAVSINGEIYRDEWGKAIPANAEVFLLPRIQGG
jgi:molybdopterin synthase sulfur carrier subunit